MSGSTLLREVGRKPVHGSGRVDPVRAGCVRRSRPTRTFARARPRRRWVRPTAASLDPTELDALYGWFDLGWQVLEPSPRARRGAGWSTVQLVAGALRRGHRPRPRTRARGEPRLLGRRFLFGGAVRHVGPWSSERPGDPAYWNAPFGAIAPRSGRGGAAVRGLHPKGTRARLDGIATVPVPFPAPSRQLEPPTAAESQHAADGIAPPSPAATDCNPYSAPSSRRLSRR